MTGDMSGIPRFESAETRDRWCRALIAALSRVGEFGRWPVGQPCAPRTKEVQKAHRIRGARLCNAGARGREAGDRCEKEQVAAQ